MLNKIFTFILLVLLIVVGITLYKTELKYSSLKKTLSEKDALINDQLRFINDKNTEHEFEIKSKSENLLFFKKNKLLIDIFGKNTEIKVYKNENQLVRGINNYFPGSGYLDYYDNKLFIISAAGLLGYSEIINGNKINFKQIKNNINQFLSLEEIKKNNWFSVKDILISKNKIFVSYTNELTENCWNTSIISADLNYNYLKFNNFFQPNECVLIDNDDKEFNAHQSGGKLYKFDEKNILFSTGDFRYRKLAQDKLSVFGKIIKINMINSDLKILSMGHRNPQGLLYDNSNNFILSTEHGPNGGDEVNLNLSPSKELKNFGWPISSYGEHYGGKDKKGNIIDEKNKIKYKKYPLHKSHKDYNFIEPLTYFVPSIGISQIIKIDSNKFIFCSLKDKSLYTFLLNNNEINDLKRIQVGERIRDMVYDNDRNNIFLYLEDTASIGIVNIE